MGDIELTLGDEGDAVLEELCLTLGLGRGRVISLSLERLALEVVQWMGDQDSSLMKQVGKIKDTRSTIEIAADEVELANMRRERDRRTGSP